jgi:hypothetical protein
MRGADWKIIRYIECICAVGLAHCQGETIMVAYSR